MSSVPLAPTARASFETRSAASRARSRVPAGVRSGGQFADEARAESGVVLADPLAGRDADLVERAGADNGAALARSALLSAQHTVRVRNLRYVSADDLAQDTITRVLEARANAIAGERAPHPATEAYVQQIAGGFGAIAARGALRAEEHKAIGIFTRRVSEKEAEMHRALTGKERDAIAEDIRATWPDQRHKPSKDFVQFAAMKTWSLDQTSGWGHRTLGDEVSERISQREIESVDPDSGYQRTMELVESGQRSAARRQVWDALAELNGVPRVTARVGRSKALSVRMVITEAGGVSEVVRRWAQTGEDTPASDALFAPFGSVDVDGKDAIADMLSRNRDRAEDLFSAALQAAAALPKD